MILLNQILVGFFYISDSNQIDVSFISDFLSDTTSRAGLGPNPTRNLTRGSRVFKNPTPVATTVAHSADEFLKPGNG